MAVKMYGASPKKLFNQINKKALIIKNRDPGGVKAPKIALNSKNKAWNTEEHSFLKGGLQLQNETGVKNKSPTMAAIQLIDSPPQATGSKMEKRLDIKMNFCCGYS